MKLFGIDPIVFSDLKDEFVNLKSKCERLEIANNVHQKRVDREMITASFAIDWDAMKVFSIERNLNNGFPTTILGYMLSEPAIHTEEQVTYKDVVREWTLHCSAEKHEQLVKEFVEWRDNK